MKIKTIDQSRWTEDAWKGAAFGSVFSDHMLVVHFKNGKWLEQMKSMLKKMELIKDTQLRSGGLVFAVIGFIIIWYIKS